MPMIRINPTPQRHLAAGLAVGLLSALAASATPYATSLTNNAGVVSFRLNEAADSVKITWNGGAAVTNLGPRARGLTVTNVGAASPFKVEVFKTGEGVLTTNSPTVAYNSPRGLAVNRNPASPYFGRVYVANSAAGTKGDGIYLLTADLVEVSTNRSGGITNFAAGGASSPYRLAVGPADDRVYVTDWSDARGNLYSVDGDVANGTVQFVFPALTTNFFGTNISAITPVGTNNNHGSVAAVEVAGSIAGGNFEVFFVDEDMQTNRESTTLNQMNSVWSYKVGAGPLPYAGFEPTNLLFTPGIAFVSQTMDLARGPNGYLYLSQYRSAGSEPGVWVITNAFEHAKPSAEVWNSQRESSAVLGVADVLRATGGVAVNADGTLLATINFENNVVTVVRLTNGIPDLTRRWSYTGLGTTAAGRDIAFDAANNIYIVSSGLAVLRSLTLGITATSTTGSDGTFTQTVPATEVIAKSTDNVTHEETPANDTATVELTRVGDTANPMTVFFTLSGTASNGLDYITSQTNSITFGAGESTATLTVTAVDDSITELSETAIFTLAGSTNYNVLEGGTVTLIVADNEAPLIAMTPLFTNMYERVATDYVRYRFLRQGGETNIAVTINLNYNGVGAAQVDFQNPAISIQPYFMDPGVVATNMDLFPIDNQTKDAPRFGTISLAPPSQPTDYAVNPTNNSAPMGIIDDELGTETVIWSEDFETSPGDTNLLGNNWNYVFAANNATADFSFMHGYDYGQISAPPAPGSSTWAGLRMTVNKYDTTGSAAALNFYRTNASATGNFAVRFNLLMVPGTSNSTEHALVGIGHSGTQTNWFRNGGTGAAYATNADGIVFAINATGGTNNDYMAFTRAASGTSALVLSNRSSGTLAQTFKSPPYSAAGSPASINPRTWVDVEMSRTPGLVSLRINGTLISQVTNTTPYGDGYVMIGYNDMFDSIGSVDACAIFDNVRVVSIGAPVITTQPVGGTVAAGSPFEFTVAATTSTSVTNYQWFRNGSPIAGATGAKLSLASVQLANYGSYRVEVSDGNYSASSVEVVLTAPAPVIVTPPASRAAVLAGSTTFNVTAQTFTGVTNFQWYLGAATVSATATNASLTLNGLTNANFGSYTVRVTDGLTTRTSTPAALLTIAVRPTVATSVSGSTFNVTFPTEVGPGYVVEYKTNLTDAAWNILSTTPGTGSGVTVPDTMVGPSRFYRVRMQ